MSTLRILFATFWRWPETTGVIQSMSDLSRRLAGEGHAVDILGHDPGAPRVHMSTGWAIPEEPARALVECMLGKPVGWVPSAEVRRYAFELCLAHLDFGSYDLVHAHDVIAARALRRVLPRGVGLVLTVHGAWSIEALYAGVGGDEAAFRYLTVAERAGVQSSDHVFVPSAGLQRQMADLLALPAQRFEVLRNGLDAEELEQSAQRGPDAIPQRRRFTVLAVGRLSPEKGFAHLLQAAALLWQRQSPVDVWLAGAGGLLGSLRQLAVDLGIAQHVRFLGPRGDVPALMRGVDAVAVPSLQDSLPYVVAEAQVIGTPVVATRTGGIPEMVHDGVTGLLVEPANAADMARKIELLMADGRLRGRIAGDARRFGRVAWASGSHMRALLSAYRAVAAAPRAAQSGRVIPRGEMQFDPMAFERLRTRGYAIPDPMLGPGLRGPVGPRR